MGETVTKQMTLLPEYQEKYLKDLLANVFSVDEETGVISGEASESPLYGKPVYQKADGSTTLDETEAAVGADGYPVQFYQAADGSYTLEINDASKDQFGQPVLAVEGGVAAPDVMRFTDAQEEAINRLVGAGGFEGMMDSYQPYLDSSKDIYQKGVDIADTSGSATFDPQSYKDYYDPFVEDVIDTSQADITDALNVQLGQMGAEAAGLGAFGNRYGLERGAAMGKSSAEAGKLGAQLRAQAFTGAQQQAQSVFENQQNRGIQAGQLFQGLGTGMGALGESQQALGFQDVNTLFNVGQLEQKQLQSEFDVQRAGQLEEAYEPFARFSYMRDILSGVPASGTGLTATGTPSSSPLANMMTNQNVYSALNSQGLGSLKNVSGA